MSNQLLSGKTALVTGGARRIGRGIALVLARAGADVAVTYLKSKDDAARTAAEIEALGCRALAVECDVRTEASVRGAIAAATGKFGRLDVLVNNAAVFESVPLERIPWNSGMRFLKPMHVGRFLWRGRLCLFCVPLRAGL